MMVGVGPAPPPWTNAPLALYHGTLERHVPSLLRGIDLRHARPRSDFGPGFYTTTSVAQAWRWAQQVSDHNLGLEPSVIRFEVPRGALTEIRCLWFIRGDAGADDFWSIVQHCRAGRELDDRSDAGSWYDVIAGPVAANWRRRRIVPDSDQVSFRSSPAIALLSVSNPRRV